jgi:hypothetical protein
MKCFQIEQRYVNNSDRTLTAEVIDLLSGGEEAFFEIRREGVLERGYFAVYGHFVENWTAVGE